MIIIICLCYFFRDQQLFYTDKLCDNYLVEQLCCIRLTYIQPMFCKTRTDSEKELACCYLANGVT